MKIDLNNLTPELQDKILANDVLERNFYSYFKRRGSGKKLELYLSGICKANCKYCYLKKHGDEIYPPAIHNNQKVIENLKIVLNWYIENKFVCELDFFSAEWLTTPLGPQVLQLLCDTFEKIEPRYRPEAILAADNMQFLKDDKLTEIISGYMEKMIDLNMPFLISASIDGKMCEWDRTEVDDEYYDKLNKFMKKYHLRLHPMVSSDNIKYWINNYQWFQKTFDKEIADDIMMLEVREHTWGEEEIGQLIQFCDFLIDDTFERLGNDKLEMLKYALGMRNISIPEGYKFNGPTYTPIRLNFNNFADNVDTFNCSFHSSLPIRLADMTVAPCHRTWYPELILGQYEIKDGKLSEFNPKNTALLIAQRHIKRSCLPHCENCKFLGVCIGFCAGASYEDYKNLLVPTKQVCEMYMAKLSFLIYKYNQMGVFDELPKIKDEYQPEMYDYLVNLIQQVLGGCNCE